jgi:hypothetical protein
MPWALAHGHLAGSGVGLGQIFLNNFLNNRQLLKRLNNGLFNCSRSTAHAQGVVKTEKILCHMT